jgi:2-polyprenyl-6-methoxyphenol hydroxylase-like FAD-dependent oxidoreductase
LNRPLNIAVIGCGIAGSASAILWKRLGYDVSLFEQSPVLRPVGAGVMLQPLGQCVLQRMGLLEKVIANAEPIHELHAVYRSGRTMIQMPFAAAGVGMHAYGVHRNDIFDVLLDEVRDHQIPITLGAAVSHALMEHGRVALQCVDGQKYPGFDRVIVANGAKCGLRSQLGFHGRDKAYDYAAIWCNVESTQVRHRLLQIVDGSTRLMGVLPLGNGRASLFWGLACRDRERCMGQSIEKWKEELKQFLQCHLLHPPAKSGRVDGEVRASGEGRFRMLRDFIPSPRRRFSSSTLPKGRVKCRKQIAL